MTVRARGVFARRSRLRAVASTLTLLGAGLGATACGSESAETAPEAAPSGWLELTVAQEERAGLVVENLAADDFALPVEVPAEVGPPDTARASFGSIVEGRVERIDVVSGDEVSEGDALIFIHSHEMMDARMELTAAEAELSYAANALARSERLFEAGAVSREEFERHAVDHEAAQAQVRRASEMVEHLDPSGDDLVTVRAPRDGVVLAVHVEPGQAVVPGDPLVEVGAPRPLWATAHLPEEHVAWLSPGAEARVMVDAVSGQALAGRVVRVGGQVDATTRTVEVRVEIADPPPGTRPGMFARVELSEAERRRGVRVPGVAVQQLEGAPVVFVRDGEHRYRAVPVEVFPLGADALLVTGLPDPAAVVVTGAPFLKAMTEQAAGGGDEG